MLKIDTGGKSFAILPDNHNPSSGTIDGQPYALNIATPRRGKDRLHVLYGNGSYEVEIHEYDRTSKTVTLAVNGMMHEVLVQDDIDLLLDRLGMSAALTQKVGEFKAPMPGLVLDVRVLSGDEVDEGDPLLVLEAMKMENVLKSPTAGVIKSISVEKGQAVEKNQVLISFE